jgi:hypothetical protein
VTGSQRVIGLRQGGGLMSTMSAILVVLSTAQLIICVSFLIQNVVLGKGINRDSLWMIVPALNGLLFFGPVCVARREIIIDVAQGSVHCASRYLEQWLWLRQMRTTAEYPLSCFKEVRVVRDRRSRLFPFAFYCVRMIGPDIELDLVDPNLPLLVNGTFVQTNRLPAFSRLASEIAGSCGLVYADATAPNDTGAATSG